MTCWQLTPLMDSEILKKQPASWPALVIKSTQIHRNQTGPVSLGLPDSVVHQASGAAAALELLRPVQVSVRSRGKWPLPGRAGTAPRIPMPAFPTRPSAPFPQAFKPTAWPEHPLRVPGGGLGLTAYSSQVHSPHSHDSWMSATLTTGISCT